VEVEQNGATYVMVDNAYVATKDNLKKKEKYVANSVNNVFDSQFSNAIKQQAVDNLRENIISRKGNLIIMLDTNEQNNQNSLQNSKGEEVSLDIEQVVTKKVVLNKNTNSVAILHNSLIVGLKNASDGETIANSYSITLVKVIGKKNPIGLYKVDVNKVLKIAKSIKDNGEARYVEADIVENMSLSQ
jgi:hypothetical protein